MGLRKWHQDIESRQRNVVFPDTLYNEARLWRNLISDKRLWGIVPAVVIALFYSALIAVLYTVALTQWRASNVHGTLWERIIGAFGFWIILLAIASAILTIGLLVRRRKKR